MTRKLALVAISLTAFTALALGGCGTLPRTDPAPPAPVSSTGG